MIKETLNRIKTLIIKELFAVWRDKNSRIVLIVPPLIQLFVFSFAATLEVKNISLAVLNNDTGKQSYDLVQRFEGSKTFKKIYYVSSPFQLRRLIDSRRVIGGIHIDDTFSKNILNGEGASIQFIFDGRRSNSAQITAGYCSRIVGQYVSDLQKEEGALIQIPKVIEVNWFNPNLDYIWYTAPCLLAILTLVVGILITALSVAREKELGTFDQLLVSPMRSWEVIFGKAAATLIVGVLEGTLIISAVVFLFQIPLRGSLFLLYIALILYLLAVIGIGLFISVIVKTQQQAALGSFVFTVPGITLSGFATPIENMPEWLQVVTVINPIKYFMIIIKGTFIKGLPAEIVLQNILPMLVIAAFTLSVSGWLFRKNLG